MDAEELGGLRGRRACPAKRQTQRGCGGADGGASREARLYSPLVEVLLRVHAGPDWDRRGLGPDRQGAGGRVRGWGRGRAVETVRPRGPLPGGRPHLAERSGARSRRFNVKLRPYRRETPVGAQGQEGPPRPTRSGAGARERRPPQFHRQQTIREEKKKV